jgi:hypothetical protein
MSRALDTAKKLKKANVFRILPSPYRFASLISNSQFSSEKRG